MNDERDLLDGRRFERLEEIFFAALSLHGPRRTAYLDRACDDELELRAAVEELLHADQTCGGVIDDPSWRVARLEEMLCAGPHDDPLAAPGVVIGGYRLIDRVGAGGMGTVWKAIRVDGAFERTVALKLMKRGLDTDEVLRRFRLERQVLARLEHPNIARLYDGGATDDGRPYLVMEYIDGVPIDQYCREGALDIGRILDLIRTVCDAVHYAHAHLVLHRDIKPGNVLVSPGPTVKLLDFGIAKVLSDDGSSLTVTADHPALTPRYASPEQVCGDRLTTASDVYSLGVLVYELLTGESPYGAHAQTRRELERAVVHEIPTLASVAASRSTTLGHGARGARVQRMRGDLDIIMARALAKSPTERYASAELLVEDLRRHQEGLPLLARGLSPTGRMLRLVRRHRRSVVTVLVATVAALAASATAVSYWFMAPRWAQEQVRAARRAFLSPEIANAIWVLTFNHSDRLSSRQRPPACAADVAHAALKRYDAALAFDSQLDEVRLERDTLRLAIEISGRHHAPPVVPRALQRLAPLTCEYAMAWTRQGVIPELTDAQLDQAEVADLRSLGLLALLCGDARDGLRAWSRLREYRSDPLVDSLLGVLFLANHEPQRAYPRLLSAYREYPELGFLCTYVADAAVAVGDLPLAGQLLERARMLEHLDPLEAHRRVQLRYYLATGQSDAAEQLFSQAGEHDNPVMRQQYARYLFDAGDRRRSLAILGEFCGGTASYRPVPAGIMRELLALTQRYWAELDDGARRDVLERVFDESPESFESLYRILDSYQVCVERARRFHAAAALDSAGEPLATDPLLDAPHHHEIESLCDRLGLRFAHRWTQFRHYPADLRARQLHAWLNVDDPARESEVIEADYTARRAQAAPIERSEYVKLLPATAGEQSFGWKVDLTADVAIVLSTSLVPYRLNAGEWVREAVGLGPGTRVVDAALDGTCILALLETERREGPPVCRAALFATHVAAGDWREVAELALPADGNRPCGVGLSGDAAYVATSAVEGVDAIHLFRRAANGESWQPDATLDVGSAIRNQYRSRPSLAGNTLALHSGYVDCQADPTCSNVLLIFRRTPGEGWRRELELHPPGHLGPRTTWTAAACEPDTVVAAASRSGGAPSAAVVLRRTSSGEWRPEVDLCALAASPDARWVGAYLACEGEQVAMGECDRAGNCRGFQLFRGGAAGWRWAGTVGPYDSAYADGFGPAALTAGRMIIGARGHDAGGLDAGAAYVVDLQSIER